MAKRKVTELEDVRIDFVSFVDRGANGKKFEIFKSADYNGEESHETDEELSKEEKSLLKRMLKFFKIHTQEEEEMAKSEEILKAIEGLGASVNKVSERLDQVESKLQKEEEDLETQEEATTEEGTTDSGASTEEETTEEASGDTASTEKGNGKDKEDDSGVEIMNAVEKLTETLKGIDERLENLENTRKSSHSIHSDNMEKSEEVSFAGIF